MAREERVLGRERRVGRGRERREERYAVALGLERSVEGEVEGGSWKVGVGGGGELGVFPGVTVLAFGSGEGLSTTTTTADADAVASDLALALAAKDSAVESKREVKVGIGSSTSSSSLAVGERLVSP